MTIRSLDELKTYFERGDRPTERQFEMLIDSLSVKTTGEQLNIKEYNQILSDVAVKKISSHNGHITLISNPQITVGVDGQQLILYGADNTNTVTIVNGSGLVLSDDITFESMVTLLLIFVESEQKWIEVARRCNGGGSGGNFDLSLLPETFISNDSDFLVLHDGTEQKKISKANFLSSIGGTFSLTIQDEGSDVLSDVNTINFSGVDVEVMSDGTNKVNVFIPPPNYASHFGTNDGTTNATINNILTNNRYVALPTSEGTPYKIDSWDGNSLRNVINDTNISYNTNGDFTIINDVNNTITVNVYDANGTTLLTSHSEIITGNLDVTNNNIRIRIIDFTNDANRYKAKSLFEIDIDNIIAPGGRFTVEFINDTVTDGIYSFVQGPLFYDPNINDANINSVTFDETPGNIHTKQISGVYYYTLNSQFTVDIASINYLNDRSYHQTQVQIKAPDFGLSQLDLVGSNLTGWTKQFDNINSSYHKTDWSITQTNFFTQSTSAIAQSRTVDWIGGSWVNSAVKNILVDTFTNNNLSVFEDFRNEIKRYQSDLTTVWDSTQFLNIIDSNTGLQLKNSKLIYPKEDFTIYYPNPTLQPNYSNLTGDRIYYSYFFHTGTSHSNGRFRLTGHNINETIISNKDCILEISLNGIDWFILNDLYLGGSLNNSDGCRINSGVYNLDTNDQIEFTLGTGGFTDASTGNGWGIWYKITFIDNFIGKNNEIGSIELVNWI
jgi:hypothetical protein